MTLTPVQSSNLAAIGYDSWNGVLVIAFHGDRVYEYFDLPHSEYCALMNASSHGKYFHAHIKGRYSYRRIQ